ncbi:DUF4377 domain-containing protein [Leptobacterium flavescens]|uniref:DUF4377 domain-containing protein n=1 Tax=Leptobacterium flavescens TaxID=472055 RepID=A0A6P0UKB0_9FLAO|nr:DUF4377 domain-containing protein [Leptobacterium flavescens]NER13664.1 DUF4377 domain-containing protein [Leptobacterium flavescens]
MKKNLFYFCIICSCVLTACSEDDTDIETLWVNEARVSCMGFVEQMCYEIQETENLGTDWSFFYDPIEGFDNLYEEGFIYRIVVERTEVHNPPQDASSARYKLVRIISKETP